MVSTATTFPRLLTRSVRLRRGRATWAAAVPRRREAAGVSINAPQFEVHEAHDPIAALRLRDPDGFMTDRRADEDEVAAPLDFPIVADPPDLVRGVVPRILEARRIRSRRRHMHVTRRSLSQRFVWPFRVEFPAQAVKPCLLLSQRLSPPRPAASGETARDARFVPGAPDQSDRAESPA